MLRLTKIVNGWLRMPTVDAVSGCAGPEEWVYYATLAEVRADLLEIVSEQLKDYEEEERA